MRNYSFRFISCKGRNYNIIFKNLIILFSQDFNRGNWENEKSMEINICSAINLIFQLFQILINKCINNKFLKYYTTNESSKLVRYKFNHWNFNSLNFSSPDVSSLEGWYISRSGRRCAFFSRSHDRANILPRLAHAYSASSHPLTLHSLKQMRHSKYWPVYLSLLQVTKQWNHH